MNKTLIDYKIAKFINFLLNNRKNLLFFFNLLNTLICIIIRDIEFFLILEIIILILTFSTKRVSKLLVYNSLFHIASMNLENVNMFKIYNYETEKDKISEIFKEELIKGLLNINSTYIKFETHKFVVENILKDERILNSFDLNYKSCGYDSFKYNVLLLNNGENINLHKREKFYVTLKRKEVKI